jgi:hypothetical protein
MTDVVVLGTSSRVESAKLATRLVFRQLRGKMTQTKTVANCTPDEILRAIRTIAWVAHCDNRLISEFQDDMYKILKLTAPVGNDGQDLDIVDNFGNSILRMNK